MYTVYCHTNKMNGKKYFGITSLKPERRWANGEGYRTSRHFYFSILAFGWENFEHEIIASGLTKAEACQMEENLILTYRTNDQEYGYNLSTGGEFGAAGVKQSAERIKNRVSKTRGRKITEETRLKMRNNALGRTFSEETLRKMSAAKKGRKLSEETKKRMSEALKGRTISEKTKEKMRSARASDMKKVYCKETEKEYASIHDAAKELSLYATNICAVCKGKHKHTKGYHFSYVENRDKQ